MIHELKFAVALLSILCLLLAIRVGFMAIKLKRMQDQILLLATSIEEFAETAKKTIETLSAIACRQNQQPEQQSPNS